MVTLALDEATIAAFRVGEPGWQSRINEALRDDGRLAGNQEKTHG